MLEHNFYLLFLKIKLPFMGSQSHRLNGSRNKNETTIQRSHVHMLGQLLTKVSVVRDYADSSSACIP